MDADIYIVVKMVVKMACSIFKDLYLTNTQIEVLAPENEIQKLFWSIGHLWSLLEEEARKQFFFYHYSLSTESTLTKSI